MLARRPEQRPSLEAIARHPWLQRFEQPLQLQPHEQQARSAGAAQHAAWPVQSEAKIRALVDLARLPMGAASPPSAPAAEVRLPLPELWWRSSDTACGGCLSPPAVAADERLPAHLLRLQDAA